MTTQLAGEAVIVPGDPGHLGTWALYDVPGQAPSTDIELACPSNDSPGHPQTTSSKAAAAGTARSWSAADVFICQ